MGRKPSEIRPSSNSLHVSSTSGSMTMGLGLPSRESAVGRVRGLSKALLLAIAKGEEGGNEEEQDVRVVAVEMEVVAEVEEEG